MNNRLLSGYEPKGFFHWFEEVSKIPRPSYHEEQIIAFLVRFAEERGLCCKTDPSGNVLIRLPATAGYEEKPSILLQGHMDMVCVKDEGVDFDFAKEPIRMRIEGNLLRACGTTLGADNATGVAVMMALADDKTIPHPPMELLFTVKEEVGLLGIREFDMSQIRSRRMVNLDSGYSHVLCVSGVGCAKCALTETFACVPAERLSTISLEISGGQGGHSGIRIHLGRVCAGNVAGELLHGLARKMPVYLRNVVTGTAILKYAKVTFAVDEGREREAASILEDTWQQIKKRYEIADPDVVCKVAGEEAASAVLSPEDSRRVIDLLYLFHTGAHKHDGIDPTIVVASGCVIACALNDGKLEFRYNIRSTDDTVRELLVGRYTEIADLLGFELRLLDQYPGWPVRQTSEMQERFKAAHRGLFGEEITIQHMHGGVEVGVVMGAIPDMDAVGISPTATNAHTTMEDLYLDEVKPFWDLLCKVLRD
ncbi:MAG: beta-Ala-His dipeptidase [Clostridia bacterium]|nr:beta-Ala-His dipeptidase [Clostridia bacterium]